MGLFWNFISNDGKLQYISTLSELKIEIEKLYNLADFDENLKSVSDRNETHAQSISDLSEKLNGLEGEILNLERQLEKVEPVVADVLKNHLENFRRDMELKQQNWQKVQAEQFENFERALDSCYKTFQNELEVRDKRIATLESCPQLADFNQKLADKNDEIAALTQRVADLEKKLADKIHKVVPPKILKFAIPKTDGVYISGNVEEISAQLKAATDVAELKTFLENSTNPQKDGYLRNLKKHGDYLQKMIKKLKLKDIAAENLSAEVTAKFFDAFKPVLFKTLVKAIYRGFDKDPEFYEKFLELLNKYLQRCGIYTRKITPNQRATEADYSDMESVTKDVDDESLKQMIFEVSQLPYYINYFDADNECKKLCNEGKMTVARLKTAD